MLELNNKLRQEQDERQRVVDDLRFQQSLKEKSLLEQDKLKAYFLLQSK